MTRCFQQAYYFRVVAPGPSLVKYFQLPMAESQTQQCYNVSQAVMATDYCQ